MLGNGHWPSKVLCVCVHVCARVHAHKGSGPMGKGSDGKSHFIAKGWDSSADKRESGEHWVVDRMAWEE